MMYQSLLLPLSSDLAHHSHPLPSSHMTPPFLFQTREWKTKEEQGRQVLWLDQDGHLPGGLLQLDRPVLLRPFRCHLLSCYVAETVLIHVVYCNGSQTPARCGGGAKAATRSPGQKGLSFTYEWERLLPEGVPWVVDASIRKFKKALSVL